MAAWLLYQPGDDRGDDDDKEEDDDDDDGDGDLSSPQDTAL